MKITNSRRSFCKDTLFLGLGFSILPFIANAKDIQKVGINTLSLVKKDGRVIKINGKVCFEDMTPVKDAIIEIWHNNSESNPLKFENEGKLTTDSEGFYYFETDFPQKYFEDGHFKMRRIFLKIIQNDGKETITKLFIGHNSKAFIDTQHWNITPEKHREELPKTKHMTDDLSIIQFNIYLNS